MFKNIESESDNNPEEEIEEHFFPSDWSDDDDCDGDEGWNKEWDDFDWDAPREDNDDDWVDRNDED